MLGRNVRMVATVGALVTLMLASPSPAQLPGYGLGRAPTEEEIKAWDTRFRRTARACRQAAGRRVGKAIYTASAPRATERRATTASRPLVGGRGTLTSAKPIKTIGSYWPYATTLWSYINRAQPFDEPGSLTHEQVYAVTAYLLHLNGIIGESDVMDARTLPAVQMPNRGGFVPDARPDVGRSPAPTKR